MNTTPTIQNRFTLLEYRESSLHDPIFYARILFAIGSMIISILLKFKFKTFTASGHFATLYLISLLVSLLDFLLFLITLISLFHLKNIRWVFILLSLVFRNILLFFSPFVLSLMTSLSGLYSLALVFQRDETLKTAFQSRKGSHVIWLICVAYSFWCHPIHGYNRNVLYFTIPHSIYPLVHCNIIDFLIMLITSICILLKFYKIRTQPNVLSNFELASLIHITLTLTTTIMFYTFEIIVITLSNSWKNYKFGHVECYENLEIWMLFSTFAPFLYPYSVAFSAIFTRVKGIENRRRTVTFNATRARFFY